MKDCIFCEIANGDPEKLVWQDDDVAVLKDLHPKAPVHLLVVPRGHYVNLDDVEDERLAGKLLTAAREAAHRAGLKGGWRLQVNNGRSAGQVVEHLHLHVMGGKQMPE